jgi:hypothetical protein
MMRSSSLLLLSSCLIPGLVFGLTQAPTAPTAPAAGAEVAAAVSGAAAAPPTGEPQAPAVEAAEEGAPASPAQALRDAVVAATQPPDGEWLIDAEGRQYFIRKHPKHRAYKLLGNSRVRVIYGAEYDMAGEDSESIWLKVYRLNEKVAERAPVDSGPTPEELAASAATFVAPVATVDRLELAPFGAGLPARGLWRNGFDLADINGDGLLDFVHGPTRRGGDQPRIYLGDGRGTWRPYRVSVPSGLLDYGDVKVADFNGDGKADLAAGSHLRGVLVFVGDGAGKFSSWREGLDFVVPKAGYDGSGFASRRIEVLDWNKDGKPDLVALSEGPQITLMEGDKAPKVAGAAGDLGAFGPKLFLNQGDGSWVAVKESGPRQEIFGDDLAVADFDVDGRPDFLTSTNAMGRKDLLYLQGGTVGGPWLSKELPLRPRAYVNAVAAGDFDGDRRPDIAASYTSFELGVSRVGVDLYRARRDGSWERRPVFVRDGRDGFSALDAGDVDGDKHLDLVATDHEGFLLLFLGDGRGGFVREESPEAQQPHGDCRGYGLRLADIDGDGRAEIVASYAGDGNALFDPTRCTSQGGVSAWTPRPAK